MRGGALLNGKEGRVGFRKMTVQSDTAMRNKEIAKIKMIT